MSISSRQLLAVAALVVPVVAALLFFQVDDASRPSAGPANSVDSAAVVAAQIERGKYLALAGNCASCHTLGSDDFMAGGLAFETPFGRIYSTNITPDADTGIGNWTGEQFLNSMRRACAPMVSICIPSSPIRLSQK